MLTQSHDGSHTVPIYHGFALHHAILRSAGRDFKGVCESVRIVASSSIFVDEMPRNDIEMGQLHSRMASAENFTGFIFSVVLEIGGEVVLADRPV